MSWWFVYVYVEADRFNPVYKFTNLSMSIRFLLCTCKLKYQENVRQVFVIIRNSGICNTARNGTTNRTKLTVSKTRTKEDISDEVIRNKKQKI